MLRDVPQPYIYSPYLFILISPRSGTTLTFMPVHMLVRLSYASYSLFRYKQCRAFLTLQQADGTYLHLSLSTSSSRKKGNNQLFAYAGDTSRNERSAYPKAGLILRTATMKDSLSSDSSAHAGTYRYIRFCILNPLIHLFYVYFSVIIIKKILMVT